MAIIQTVNEYDFRRAFDGAGRGKQFSYAGLSELFDMVNDLSDDAGEPIELDVIGLCCEYEELTFDEVLANYDTCREAVEADGTIDQDDLEDVADAVGDWLNDNTFARQFTRRDPATGRSTSAFIIQQF